MRAPSGTCAAPTWDKRPPTAPQGVGHLAWDKEQKAPPAYSAVGLALQDDGRGHGRYDPAAGEAPQEPTLAAGAPSSIKDITGFVKHNNIPQFDGGDNDDGSEDECGRMSRTAHGGHSPPPPPLGRGSRRRGAAAAAAAG